MSITINWKLVLKDFNLGFHTFSLLDLVHFIEKPINFIIQMKG
jgi:hypothetical protein